MKKILISGGSGKFGKAILTINKKFTIYAPNKKQMNILSYKNILDNIKKIKPNYFIHSAALTAPMIQHENNSLKSIDTNIIGTANVAKACQKEGVKLIYISTNFVYPGLKGKYKESDYLYPVNAYGWSKLGGECSVILCKKSLILRICMTEDIYPHKIAYDNYITSFMKKTDTAKIILKTLDNVGIINIGGPAQTVYEYAKKYDKNVIKGFLNKKNVLLMGKNTSMNINKLKKIKIND